MDESRLLALLAQFHDVPVLAVGDIYLDEMIEGAVLEVSLEAPIPVFTVHRRKYNPGAAGNAACNAASLGGRVQMVGVIGADTNGEIVKREFEARGVATAGIVVDPARPTNTYTKMRAGGHNIPTQEVLRMDTPRPQPISGATEDAVCEAIRARAPQVKAVLVGDQVSSTITPRVWETIRECAQAHGLITLVDSRHRPKMFAGATVLKPNDAEAGNATGIKIHDDVTLEAAAAQLRTVSQHVFITRGGKGISVFQAGAPRVDVPVPPCSVVDVTGAGDTVAAASILTLVVGGTLVEAATLGNAAASIAVGREGAVTVARDEVEGLLRGTRGPAKLKSLEELRVIVRRLQGEGQRVVWTNGCFDILHPGHITYLLRARALGDCLVLGLNSDASVQRIKGPSRPVVNERDRAIVLSALTCVDYLVFFDAPSPIDLIATLQPNVYAKGGDYTIDSINQEERRIVEGFGGEIAIIPGVVGASTTSIIEKVLAGERG